MTAEQPDRELWGGQPFRTMPHNIEAEKSLLGAIFVNNKAFGLVAEFLQPEHFSYKPHAEIFDATSKLIEADKIADPVTLRRYLEGQGTLADIGGAAYLLDLAASAVTVINAGEYGRLIHDLYLRRELVAIGEELVRSAHDSPVDQGAVMILEKAEQDLFDIGESVWRDAGPEQIKHYVDIAIAESEAAKDAGGVSGLPTGLTDLDALLGGMHDTDLIVLAGRPSMGKSALAQTIAFNVTRMEPSHTVLFFSLEMAGDQIALREIGAESGISSHRLRTGHVNDLDFEFVRDIALKRVASVPLWIDDRPAISIQAIRSTARRLHRRQRIGLVVVDYLQLIAAKAENRVQEVGAITRGLKAIAKELHVPLLALSQLSRAVEDREPPRPQLSDLRESGSIEQDADVVMFIYREDYYLQRKKPAHRENEEDNDFNRREGRWRAAMEKVRARAEIIVAKQRHGPTGTVDLHFEQDRTRFENAARENQ